MVGNSTDIGTDKKNIQQHYLLIKAIEEISKGNNTRDIFIAERQIYEIEENERMVTKNRKGKVCFSVHCKLCDVVITDGNLMRHVNRAWYIVCDKIVLKNVEKRRPIPNKKQKKIDGMRKIGKAYGRECGHKWGSIVVYKEEEFLALTLDNVKIFDRQVDKFVDCWKWSDLQFKIELMSYYDFYNYKMKSY